MCAHLSDEQKTLRNNIAKTKEAGLDAFHEGIPLIQNPFIENSDLSRSHYAWDIGWCEAFLSLNGLLQHSIKEDGVNHFSRKIHRTMSIRLKGSGLRTISDVTKREHGCKHLLIAE